MIGKFLCKKYFTNKKKQEEKIDWVDSETYYSYYENSESDLEKEPIEITNSISDIVSTDNLYSIPLTSTEIDSDECDTQTEFETDYESD
jgi:hypothetical protein